MKTIAIMNQKGGIGKTMTAASIAYLLGEEQGKKVLLVDADQQGNVSMLYDRYKPEGIGMSELLERHRSVGGSYKTTDLIQTTPYHNIDIITANGYLMRTNMNLLLNEKEDQILRFAAAMLEVQDVYDYCVVDCGLLLDMTVTNVLVATDLVILPVKIGGFEIEAIANMDEQLEDLRSLNDRIRMKILMTMRQKNQTSLQVEAWLKESSGQDCFVTAVRRSIIAEKATMQRVPLPKFSKNCIVTQDYRNVGDGTAERYGGIDMEIDGQVTISLKTFNQLQDRAKQADELKKKMQDLQEEITDIIDQIDESEAEPIFHEIDDRNMTDKQIQKRFDEAIAKFRIILDPEKTKRLIQKYIEKDRSDSHADVKNASRKVLEQITITMKAEEE